MNFAAIQPSLSRQSPAQAGGLAGQLCRKVAVFTMDVEEWYHLDYFLGTNCDKSKTVLDGLDVYLELLQRFQLPATFFVVGELMSRLRSQLAEITDLGHEVAAHSWEHIRPILQNLADFREDARRTRVVLEDGVQREIHGYRAPSYGMDRARLEVLREVGYNYDSSRIAFEHNRRYGQVDMRGFSSLAPGVYRNASFYEFEVSTLRILGQRIPVAGGGYFRLLPWSFMRRCIARYVGTSLFYVFYIHPYEFSRTRPLPLPSNISQTHRWRYSHGHRQAENRFVWLVRLLKRSGFEFSTFSQYRRCLEAV